MCISCYFHYNKNTTHKSFAINFDFCVIVKAPRNKLKISQCSLRKNFNVIFSCYFYIIVSSLKAYILWWKKKITLEFFIIIFMLSNRKEKKKESKNRKWEINFSYSTLCEILTSRLSNKAGNTFWIKIT